MQNTHEVITDEYFSIDRDHTLFWRIWNSFAIYAWLLFLSSSFFFYYYLFLSIGSKKHMQ